jgi:GDP-fucose protein O-fucosyltransferase
MLAKTPRIASGQSRRRGVVRGILFIRWILFCTAISCLLLSKGRLWVHLLVSSKPPSLDDHSLQYDSKAILTSEMILIQHNRKGRGSQEGEKNEAAVTALIVDEANADSTARIADPSTMTKHQGEEVWQFSQNDGNILENKTHNAAASNNVMRQTYDSSINASITSSQQADVSVRDLTVSNNVATMNNRTPPAEILREGAFMKSTEPDPNQRTLGYYQRVFGSGFRNQAMTFTSFVMYAYDNNYTQILLPTLTWKDLHGSGRGARHELLFDVVHWNSFHPPTAGGLPRLVRHHDSFTHFNITTGQWTMDNLAERDATRPFAFGRQKQLWNRYRAYTKNVVRRGHAVHPAMRIIMGGGVQQAGALKPHPDLQQHIDRLRGSLVQSDNKSTTASVGAGDVVATTTINNTTGIKNSYICLHARVEPDMQNHMMCRHQKVIHLAPILQMLQTAFPHPPADTKLFIAINRPLLAAVAREKDPAKQNTVGLENLAVLNRARDHGLQWGNHGHRVVQVFEGGWSSLKKTPVFKKFPSISGSIVDYFLALDADVFIGTQVSSFSADIVATRFLRGNLRNHWYLPNGLIEATNANTTAPPRFRC